MMLAVKCICMQSSDGIGNDAGGGGDTGDDADDGGAGKETGDGACGYTYMAAMITGDDMYRR